MRMPTRSELLAHPPVRFRAGRNLTKADIYLWEQDGRRLIVKDYTPRPFWIRTLLGRAMIGREIRAYRCLAGVPGIPKLVGRIDSYAFAVEFVDGRDLSHFGRGELSLDFFSQLLLLVESVHQAGVAQGDLHHRDILMGPGGRPYLVDFSTAQFRGKRRPSSGGSLFRAACGSDRRAVLKLKKRHFPDSLSKAESLELSHPPAWYRLGKSFRRFFQPGSRRVKPGR